MKFIGHSIQNKTEFTFFSSAHGTFSRIDHILGHKSSLSKFKKTEIISSIISDNNAMRLDINYRKRSVKNTNTWRLHNTLLNNQEITDIKEEIKKYLETNDNENTTTQILQDAAKAVLREKFIVINAYIKKRERGTSLVSQWLRICLPMQGTRVQALVQEDPTGCRAAKPVHHNY